MFRTAIKNGRFGGQDQNGTDKAPAPRPRWVRVNTLKTTLAEQLESTFLGFQRVERLQDLEVAGATPEISKKFFLDKHVPNLLAVSTTTSLTKEQAYLQGKLNLQDKASCLPAVLLDPGKDDLCVDACAAPGNKTTHLAAIMAGKKGGLPEDEPSIHACERDRDRAKVLRSMVAKTGAEQLVKIHTPQDFLNIDPKLEPWNQVTMLLLDPSCSGSGIVGRDDVVVVILPRAALSQDATASKKRKRAPKQDSSEITVSQEDPKQMREEIQTEANPDRLAALSAFQLKIVLHAFAFPKARKVVYSTCSLHAEENEQVVVQALSHSQKRHLGWRVLEREEQVAGMRSWPIRGVIVPTKAFDSDISSNGIHKTQEACIRCEKDTSEGTQGFFVAGFVRDGVSLVSNGQDEEWSGFSDNSEGA